MTGPTPQSAVNGLIERINQVRIHGSWTNFQLESFFREAQRLVKADSVAAYAALGIIASLRGDVADVHSKFLNAIRLGPSNVVTYENHLNSLSACGLVMESAKVSVEYATIFPAEISLLCMAIRMNVAVGALSSAEKIYGRLAQCAVHQEALVMDEANAVSALKNIYSVLSVCENDFYEISTEAETCIRSVAAKNSGKPFILDNISIYPYDDDGQTKIGVDYRIVGDRDAIAELNDLFIENTIDNKVLNELVCLTFERAHRSRVDA